MENVEALMTGLAGDEAPVRLAASPTIAEFVLPGPLVNFEGHSERHLCVELFIANSETVRELVGEGRCELGLAATDPDQEGGSLQELPFLDDEVVVAVPEGHAWAAREEIEIEDLVQMPMVMRDPGASSRRVVESALAAKDLSLSPPLAEVGSTSAAKATAHSERAPVLLSRLALRDRGEGLVVRPVRGLRFRRRFVVVIASEEALAPAARTLVHHLCDALHPHSTS
jgi:DNA-binding transcriptional LysR family regulator